jgi:hypothetical protein
MIETKPAQHFAIQELVPEEVFLARGQRAWQLIDNRLIENYDALREQLGTPITINDWTSGGNRSASGLRVPGMAHFSLYSMHTFGKAGDSVCSIPAQDIRNMIKAGEIEMPHPACFEEFDGMSWFHMDVRNFSNGHTYFFKP